MTSTWVLVANHSRARFFSVETSSALQELEDMCHSEARLHDRELTEDLPGKIKNAGGVGGHAFEQPTDPKQHEADVFAHRIVRFLEDACKANRFDRLLLIAEPSMLGLLRKAMPDTIARHVAFELDKNITTFDIPGIMGHLPKALL